MPGRMKTGRGRYGERNAEPLCSQGYVLCARAPDPLSHTAFLPYLYQLRDDSNVAGFLTDSEWPGLHLPTSCQPPEMQQGFLQLVY